MKRVELGELHPLASEESLPGYAMRVRRWPYVVAIVFLTLLASALGAGFGYSANSAQEWRASAQSAEKDLADMTKQRNVLNGQLGELRTQLGDMTSKYDGAAQRIRSLSNEKAQTGDEAAYLATLVVMSQKVTAGMDSCIKDLQGLQKYLVDFKSYDFTALSNYSRTINSGCNQARADSDALSRKLAGLG